MNSRTTTKPAREVVGISEAARRAGVSKQTVEYYILIGLIDPIRPGGRRGRHFDSGLIGRVKRIRRANRAGATLREIRERGLTVVEEDLLGQASYGAASA